MKNIIAASLIALSSSVALAESFDYERAIGAPNLFVTLVTDGVMAKPSSGESSAVFAYERALGTPDLFPTLESASARDEVSSDAVVDDIPIWRDVFAQEADLAG